MEKQIEIQSTLAELDLLNDALNETIAELNLKTVREQKLAAEYVSVRMENTRLEEQIGGMRNSLVDEVVHRQSLQIRLQKTQCELDAFKKQTIKTKKISRISRKRALQKLNSTICGKPFNPTIA